MSGDLLSDPAGLLVADPSTDVGLRAPFQIAQAHEEAQGEHGAESELSGDDHDAEPATYELPLEFPNIYTLTKALLSKDDHGGHEEDHSPFAADLINPFFSIFYAGVFIAVVARALKNKSLETPSRLQVAVEVLFQGLFDFFGEIVGERHARKYVPFIGSLWLFILLNNLFGLIPFFKSPTAHLQTTGALALCTFCYVNYQGIKAGGFGHYLWHLCGSPTDVVGWMLMPLMLVLETIGTFIKPVSLALRLFGNIMGEDKLLATFLGLGMLIVGALFKTATPPIGIPLHLPFLFLATLTSVIQATVFAMLSAVYITLLLPHEHHEHIEDEKGEGLDPIVA